MRSAKIYDFSIEKAHRLDVLEVKLKTFDTLDCFKCEQPIKPVEVSSENEVTYCCEGHGQHRKFWFRIDSSGAMLYGRKGRRYYR